METDKKLIAFVLPSRIKSYIMDVGWGNGYVAIPEGHPCFGMDYDAIYEKYSHIEAHGGLTWSALQDEKGLTLAPDEVKGMWVVGFDTAHYGDTLERWPELMVRLEAERLKRQLEEILLTH